MAKTISVRRKGYRRKGYTAIRRGKKVKVGPARVNPSTFKIRDRGKADEQIVSNKENSYC